MAERKICDRCGKEIGSCKSFTEAIADKFRTHMVIQQVGFGNDFIFDLCENCEAELYDWINRKECKCSKNESVLELLDQLESAEKQICDLKEQVEILQQKNKALSEEQIKKLLEKCHISFEMRFEDQL